jgi:hypothetical protein
MNSQVGVQSDINLHKPKERVDGVSWSQNYAQMNHEQDTPWPKLGEKSPPPFL